MWRTNATTRSKIRILTNPYGCVIGWPTQTQEPMSNSTHFFPYHGYHYFASQYFQYLERWITGTVDRATASNGAQDEYCYANDPDCGKNKFTGYLFSSGRGYNAPAYYPAVGDWWQVLVINCRDSVRSIMSAELTKLDYNQNDLPTATGDRTISTATFVNRGQQELKLTLEVSKEIQTTVSLSFTESTRSVTELGVSVGASTSIGFPSLDIGTEINTEMTRTQSWEKLNEKGSASATATTTTFKETTEITVPAGQVATVSIVMSPIQGSLPFTGYYSIRCKAKEMGTKGIIKALERIGFRADDLTVDGDHIYAKYQGTMSLDSGFDTRIEPSFSPVTSSSADTSTDDSIRVISKRPVG